MNGNGMSHGRNRNRLCILMGLLLLGRAPAALAQCGPSLPPPDDGEYFYFSLNGQTVQPNASGSFLISNVSLPDFAPADFTGDDYLFLTAVKITGDETLYAFGQIPFKIEVGERFVFGTGINEQHFSTFTTTPPVLAESIALQVDCAAPGAPEFCGSTITPIGANGQCPNTIPCAVPLLTTATLSDGSQVPATLPSQWTTYRTSNASIARVVPDNPTDTAAMLVEGVSPGVAFITATNSGATSVIRITVANPGDLISTTVEGFVRNTEGSPVSAAITVQLPTTDDNDEPMLQQIGTGTSDATGFFSIATEPLLDTTPEIFAEATLTMTNGLTDSGSSVSVIPIAGGITDVGVFTIDLVCETPWSTAFGQTTFELIDLGGSPEINALTVFDDGTGPVLYVAGFFNRAGGVPAYDIARWNGRAWEPVGGGITPVTSGGFPGTIHSMEVVDLQDGSEPALYIVGSFVLAGGVSTTHVARWDGSEWSALGDGVGRADFDDAFAVAGFNDGSGMAIYVGGRFQKVGGVEPDGTCTSGSSCVDAMNIAKWDGTSWSAVGDGIDTGPVNALAVFDDDGTEGTNPPLLYIGGEFFLSGDSNIYNIAKWDGVSLSGVGYNGLPGGAEKRVTALTVFDDGSGTGAALYAGGNFRDPKNSGGSDPVTVNLRNIARWDGGAWSALGSSLDDDVLGLAGLDDGVNRILYASGQFKDVDGGGVSGLNRVAQWNGTEWLPLGTGIEFSRQSAALAVFDDGAGPALFVGGAVADGSDCSVGGSELPVNVQGYVAKWDDPEWSVLGKGLNDEVRAMVVHDDGSGAALFAGGSFIPPKGPCDSNESRFPSGAVAGFDGTQWSSLGAGLDCTGFGCVASVNALAVFDEDGANPNPPFLFAGGDFTLAGGTSANNMARWDGSNWSALGGGGVNGNVEALAVFDDDGPGTNLTALYAGGSFTQAGTVTVTNVARWDGTNWSALGGGITGGSVFAMAVFDDGNGSKLYVGGDFSGAGGVPNTSFLARWDGSAWSAVRGSVGGGVSGAVYALTVFDDDAGPALFVGGEFLMPVAGSITANRVAKWDGVAWSALRTGLGPPTVSAIRVDTLFGFDDGSGPLLYAGGDFTTAGGSVDQSGACVPDTGCIPVSRLARWNPILDEWSAVGVSSQTGSDPGGGVDTCSGSGCEIRVNAFAVFDDGANGPTFFAGGAFETASGVPSSNIAKLGCR